MVVELAISGVEEEVIHGGSRTCCPQEENGLRESLVFLFL